MSNPSANSRKVEVTLWSSVRKPLTYSVPADLEDEELLGRRAIVSIASRKQVGVITALHAEFAGRTKSVESFPDLGPVLAPNDLEVCRFLSDYYFAPLGECLKAYLPPAMTARLRQCLLLVAREELEGSAAAGDTLASRLLSSFGDKDAIRAELARNVDRRKLLGLIREGVLAIEWQLPRTREHASEHVVSLSATPGDSTRLGPKAAQVLEHLERVGNSDLTSLRRELGVSNSTIKSLVRRELITLSEKPGFWHEEIAAQSPDLTLTAEQQSAVEELSGGINSGEFSPFLLHGVTGAGKTEVYVRAIETATRCGGQAIVVVPEIGLAHAMYQRLLAAFGNSVALIHSRLTARSRLRIWQLAREGKISIVLGPRSAIFTPFPNLKLIVVDEEHDQSLKQDSPMPRYHARDVALFRGSLEKCAVILGSATPAVETFHNAISGRFKLLRLSERVDRRALPAVSVVDLKKAFEEEKRGFLTEQLIEGIQRSLDMNGQVMLLLNRRGFAPSVHCYQCGKRLTCKSCSVTLVYHKRENEIRCHTCGHREPYPEVCPGCGGNLFMFRGIGTEKLQEELHALFPNVEIERMDLDSTRRKGSFREIYDRFRKGHARILIGTQMIAKGFDFPDVALVGIVSADTALGLPDFRARERTFQLLTQAAGRAGRQRFPGEVILQTLHPDDITVAMATHHDYESFYQAEIAERQALNFPPFARLILIAVEAGDEAYADKVSGWIADALGQVKQKPYQLLGPVVAPVSRRRSLFRYHLLLKTTKVRTTLRYLEAVLQHKSLQNRRKLSIIVDVDAIEML